MFKAGNNLGKLSKRQCSEAVSQRSSTKKVLLTTLQNSQENTSAKVFFVKVAGVSLKIYLKRDSGMGVFL